MPTLKVLVRKIFPRALESSGAVSRDAKTASNKAAAAKAKNSRNSQQKKKRKPSATDPGFTEDAGHTEADFAKETWELGETTVPTMHPDS